MTMRTLTLAVTSLLLAAAAAAEPRGDHATALLAARAERAAEAPQTRPAELLDVDPGTQLFFFTGPDNASCVRSIPDVNGDGLDEVIAGIDMSGTDNLFALDGASSGAATVVWSLETTGGLSGGSPWGDQSLEPASDSDGNGFANILLGTAWGGRTAYGLDGQAGSALWRFDTYSSPDSGWVYSLAETDDVTGDGVPEVAFGTGSDSNSVYLVSGADVGGAQAAVVWRYPAPDAVLSVRNLGDVNDDGHDDVLAAVGDDGDLLVALDGDSSSPTGGVIWTHDPGVSTNACGVMPDITGDGVAEALALLWTLDGSAVRALDGATGDEVWRSTQVSDYAMMVDTLEDITGDGKPELVVSSWENAVIVLDGGDGSQVWKTTVGTLNGGDVWTARAISDLDGDGLQDVIAGSFDTHVYAMSGVDGTVLWAFSTDNRIFSVYPVGDLDGDGRPEVAAGTQDTNNNVVVHVLDGDSGIAVIFADGFESGDTSAWTFTVP